MLTNISRLGNLALASWRTSSPERVYPALLSLMACCMPSASASDKLCLLLLLKWEFQGFVSVCCFYGIYN